MTPKRKEPDMSTYSGRLAARLRQLRERRRLTVEDVATKLGVDKFRIYKWESGVACPPYDLLPALSAAYGLKTVRALLPEH